MYIWFININLLYLNHQTNKNMEYIQKQLEISIGVIDYSMIVEFKYKDLGLNPDPTEESGLELIGWSIESTIKAYNNDTDQDYNVTDKDEYDMVEDWIDWEEEFNNAI